MVAVLMLRTELQLKCTEIWTKMARDPKEFKASEGRPYLVNAKEVTADKIKEAGERVKTAIEWVKG